MKKVFISVRYDIDETHSREDILARAKYACQHAMLDGYAPVCPALFYEPLWISDGEQPRYEAMVKSLVRDCDEIWQYGATVDAGMTLELDEARALGKPIRIFNGIGIPYEDWNSVKFASDPAYRAACADAGQSL